MFCLPACSPDSEVVSKSMDKLGIFFPREKRWGEVMEGVDLLSKVEKGIVEVGEVHEV